jgi:DNA topoisomerase 2-associated protein PAT1
LCKITLILLKHSPNSGMGPLPYMRADHPLMPPYANNHQNMQHNLHIGNQRKQNKQLNHNDRQENHHQPFFRNNHYHHYNQNHINRYHLNPIHHGHPMHHYIMNYHQNHMPSNGIGPSGEHDEYAGLMNNREKQWLNNIQLLQLNTNQPYIDDYYYTVFCDRLNKKNEIKNRKKIDGQKSNNNNNGYHRDSR